jgi:hypothetical protein
MGGFRLVFGPFNHQEGLDEVIAHYGVVTITHFFDIPSYNIHGPFFL